MQENAALVKLQSKTMLIRRDAAVSALIAFYH